MSPHGVENTVRRDQRFARAFSAAVVPWAAHPGRAGTRGESFVFIAPFHHDTVSDLFAHESTPSLEVSMIPKTCRTWYRLDSFAVGLI